jgi:hypothetical protein
MVRCPVPVIAAVSGPVVPGDELLDEAMALARRLAGRTR